MFAPDEICPALDEPALRELDPAALSGFRYFGGHLSLLPLALLPEPPAIVTVVRNPLTHMRSYFEHTRLLVADEHAEPWRTSFAEWLSREDTRVVSENLQARQLAGSVDAIDRYDDDELFDRAVATLNRCLWFSITERLDSSVSSLAAALGWPAPTNLRRSNVSPGARPPTTEEREPIRRRTRVDARLYEYAARHAAMPHRPSRRPFARQLRRMSEALRAPLVVDLDHPFWGEGWVAPMAWWHPDQPSLAHLGDRAARWLAFDEPAYVDLPVRLRRGDHIEAFAVATVSVPSSLDRLEVAVNGRVAERVDVQHRPPHMVLTYRVPETRGRHTQLTFRAPVPLEAGDRSGPPEEGRVVALERLRLVPNRRAST